MKIGEIVGEYIDPVVNMSIYILCIGFKLCVFGLLVGSMLCIPIAAVKYLFFG